LFTLHLRL